MTKDYKPAQRKTSGPSKFSVFFTGFLIGLLLGVGAAVATQIYMQKGDALFVPKVKTIDSKQDGGADKVDNLAKNTEQAPKSDKNRFDFYTILPGSETQVTEQEVKIKENEKAQSKPTEAYFLQTGAYQSEDDADNMKAKLALLGIEAIIQTADIPDKGVWHRVRVGPMSNLDEINKTRSELTKNGFNADLIKIKTSKIN